MGPFTFNFPEFNFNCNEYSSEKKKKNNNNDNNNK